MLQVQPFTVNSVSGHRPDDWMRTDMYRSTSLPASVRWEPRSL